MNDLAPLWRRAFLIRAFEERLLALFAEGKLQGTVHTCSGQEWSALAVAQALRPNDKVLSNHRGHGHFLARHPELLRQLLAEIMGLAEGLCGGIGGSQHLYTDGFYSSGVQGGMAPIAAGMALADKLLDSDGVTVIFIGDGTTGEGIIYEAMNLAAIWQLPVLLVLERNGYAQSTPTGRTIAGDIGKRAEGFGFAFHQGDVWEPDKLCVLADKAVAEVRGGAGPAMLEIECFRLNAHSKGDDNRPSDLIAAFRHKDPLNRFAHENPVRAAEYIAAAEKGIDAAIAAINSEPCRYSPPATTVSHKPVWRPLDDNSAGVRHGESLRYALRAYLNDYADAVLIGEDVESPYGGAFKITRELSDLFPGRVRNTPISEAGIVGTGIGLALAGHRAIVEIMFGDFLTLAFDQLQQHAAKFSVMSNGRLQVPLIVRSPSGGRRGYGPTHSQSLEKHFLGIPGLTVLALNSRVDPAVFFRAMAKDGGPFLLIENKSLYGRHWPAPLPEGYVAEVTDEAYPTVRIRPKDCKADVTIACYGGMLDEAESALAGAFEMDEILCEIVCYSRLTPFNTVPLFESLGTTERLLTLEEGPGFAAWGSELAARAVESGISLRALRRLGYDGIIPASAVREAELLPGETAICEVLKTFGCQGG